MTTPIPELPQLPEARQFAEHGIGWFTAGQMQAYARAAIEAATEQGKRQPLSDEQIIDLAVQWPAETNDWASHFDFARAIEAAHGITATPQGNI